VGDICDTVMQFFVGGVDARSGFFHFVEQPQKKPSKSLFWYPYVTIYPPENSYMFWIHINDSK
jgi:hypothetical protein